MTIFFGRYGLWPLWTVAVVVCGLCGVGPLCTVAVAPGAVVTSNPRVLHTEVKVVVVCVLLLHNRVTLESLSF